MPIRPAQETNEVSLQEGRGQSFPVLRSTPLRCLTHGERKRSHRVDPENSRAFGAKNSQNLPAQPGGFQTGGDGRFRPGQLKKSHTVNLNEQGRSL